MRFTDPVCFVRLLRASRYSLPEVATKSALLGSRCERLEVAETMEADGKGRAQPPTMKKGEGTGPEPTSKSGTDKSAAKALQ